MMYKNNSNTLIVIIFDYFKWKYEYKKIQMLLINPKELNDIENYISIYLMPISVRAIKNSFKDHGFPTHVLYYITHIINWTFFELKIGQNTSITYTTSTMQNLQLFWQLLKTFNSILNMWCLRIKKRYKIFFNHIVKTN